MNSRHSVNILIFTCIAITFGGFYNIRDGNLVPICLFVACGWLLLAITIITVYLITSNDSALW